MKPIRNMNGSKRHRDASYCQISYYGLIALTVRRMSIDNSTIVLFSLNQLETKRSKGPHFFRLYGVGENFRTLTGSSLLLKLRGDSEQNYGKSFLW